MKIFTYSTAILLTLCYATTQQRAVAGDSTAATSVLGQLHEVVVTAERRTESEQRVPISMSVFNADAIKSANITEMRDYLQFAPNISFTEDGQNGPRSIQLAIRGVGNINISDNAQQPAIGYYIDGLDVGAVAMGTLNPDLGDVKQIEVLRGPQGTFYGRNAEGGAINIVTNRPDNQPFAEFDGGYANFETSTAQAILNQPLSDTLFARALLGYTHTDGNIRNVNPTGTRSDGYTDQDVRLALRYLASERLTLDLSATYHQENAGFDDEVPSGVIDGDTRQTLGLPSNFPPISQGLGFYPQNQSLVNHNYPEYTDTKVGVVNGQVDYHGNGFEVVSVTGYVYSQLDRLFDEDQTSAALFSRLNHWHASSYSEDVRAQSTGAGRWTWVVGLDFAKDRYFQFNNIYGGGATSITDTQTGVTTVLLPPFIYPGFVFNENSTDLTVRSAASYAEAGYNFSDHWSLTLGGRYTHDDVSTDQFGIVAFGSSVPSAAGSSPFSKFTPRAVLKYDINRSVSTYATVSTGYRAGGVDVNNGIVTTFLPETLKNYELGAKSTFADDRIRVNAAVFDLQWTNLQVETDYLANGNISSSVEKTLNASSASSRGAELEVQAVPADGLQIDITGGFLDAHFGSFPNAVVHGGYIVDLTGRGLPNTPKWTLSQTTQYTFPLHWRNDMDGYLRVDGTFRSWMYGNLDAVAAPLTGLPEFPYREPEFTVWNIRGGIMGDNWRFEVYSENVFDRTYYDGTFDHFGLGGIRLKPHPRVFGIRVTYKTS